jgi:hypothetical protein
VRAGVADLILLHDGQFFALELKAPGGRLTESQAAFLDDVEAAGGIVGCAEGLDAALRSFGTLGPFEREDGVMDESRVRYRAKRAGYYVVQTRGLENKRREEAGVGTYMLLSHDGTALSAATLDDIREFLEAHDQAQRRQLH